MLARFMHSRPDTQTRRTRHVALPFVSMFVSLESVSWTFGRPTRRGLQRAAGTRAGRAVLTNMSQKFRRLAPGAPPSMEPRRRPPAAAVGASAVRDEPVPRSAVGGGRGAAAERVHSCRGAPIPRDDSGQRCGAPRLGRFAATPFPLRTSAEPAPRPRSVPSEPNFLEVEPGHLILIAAVSGNNSSQLRLHYVHTDGAIARKHRDAAAREQAAGG